MVLEHLHICARLEVKQRDNPIVAEICENISTVGSVPEIVVETCGLYDYDLDEHEMTEDGQSARWR
jgi:hypothetical protein